MSWEDEMLAATKRLSGANLDWDAVSERDRDLAALFKVEADMHNGGFLLFFCNWGPPGLRLARAALARIGATERAALLERAYAAIAHHEDDDRLETLWDLAKVLTDEEAAALAQIDAAYGACAEDVEHLGERFFR